MWEKLNGVRFAINIDSCSIFFKKKAYTPKSYFLNTCKERLIKNQHVYLSKIMSKTIREELPKRV